MAMNTAFAANDLSGDITMQVLDNSPLPAPNTVLVRTAPFHIQVDWSVEGLVSPMLGGDFTVEAFAESIGPGPEVSLGSINEPVANSPADPLNNNRRSYTRQITVPANTLDVSAYKIVVLLTHTNGVATALAGLAEAPLIQITEP